MNKQELIEKLASLMADCNTTCDKCFEKLESVMTLPIQKRENYCQVYAYAQRAVEQGYRNTFTSDLASDTQKAFKEGYIKGNIDGMLLARKETAREILTELKNTRFHKGKLTYDFEMVVNRIAKQYDVEVEE